MKSKEIYILVGSLLILGAFVWWGGAKGGSKDLIKDVSIDKVSTTTPTGGTTTSTQSSSKPSTPTVKTPTSVNPTVTQEKPVPTLVTNKNLAGSTFRLTTYNGVSVPADAKFTMSFTDNSFDLKICNNLSSNYFINGNKIQADNVLSTAMYCSSPANIMKMESDALILLNSKSATIYRSGSTLILSEPRGIVLSFEGF